MIFSEIVVFSTFITVQWTGITIIVLYLVIEGQTSE
jgi:hypothetical protein